MFIRNDAEKGKISIILQLRPAKWFDYTCYEFGVGIFKLFSTPPHGEQFSDFKGFMFQFYIHIPKFLIIKRRPLVTFYNHKPKRKG